MNYKKLLLITFSILTLTACNSYKVKVDLTPEQTKDLQAKIVSLKNDIAHYVSTDGADGAVDWKDAIDLATTYESLGERGEAIKLYEGFINKKQKTKAMLNNLGRLYEKTEQYSKAVAIYQRLNDEYLDSDYLYDITWVYIKTKDLKNAEKYFNAWQLKFKKTDEQTQEAIKQLKNEQASKK